MQPSKFQICEKQSKTPPKKPNRQMLTYNFPRDEVNAICGRARAGKISDYLAAREDFTQKSELFCYFVIFFVILSFFWLFYHFCLLFCHFFGYFFNFFNKYYVWGKKYA